MELNLEYKLKPKPEITNFACMICSIKPSSQDENKYKAKYIGKTLRPLLEHIVGNVYKCPKCGSIHYSRDFHK